LITTVGTLQTGLQAGKRRTRQRRAVLEAVRNCMTHPDAQWVYEQVRKELPRISLGTVYRNLDLLSREGFIQQLKIGGSYTRYDGDVHSHSHITCRRCGMIENVDVPPLSSVIEEAISTTHFSDVTPQLDFYGICMRCRQQAN